ncbi:MAG TPA: flavodoxin-dependent (E)-4-hydroxy-3-methylbut-2-enyl-diphosphate synthase [candidate division Zixibacteria bacterium]|nr:flavodoxin-dependent (E)-4-hydroxy-3-methylbut-2-enyl-diphosphate synthase [candidate division Zixibacteria bacterium]
MPKIDRLQQPIRRQTREVRVGRVVIGSSAHVSIQSMLSVPLTDFSQAVAQAERLAEAGCDIIRVAVPDKRTAATLKEFRQAVKLPLVADIHFDYHLALAAVDAGFDKLRINPGNIGDPERVKAVAEAAKNREIPIRIGVNAGSLPADLANSPDTAQAMVTAALREVEHLESVDFRDIVVSMKSHDVLATVRANQIFAEMSDIPIHLGVTEAGLPGAGTIKNAVGIGSLLLDGIGDTIRVSLTGDPALEIVAGRHILRASGHHVRGVELVSCPTCGRSRVDVESIALEVERRIPIIDKHIVVAIMGCEVNGPGEARDADIGFAGTADGFIVFEKGEVCGKISGECPIEAIIKRIEAFIMQ